jgi:hypothetical protein
VHHTTPGGSLRSLCQVTTAERFIGDLEGNQMGR